LKHALTYGLKDGKLAKITEVENGLACGCICSNCGNKLVARNNPLNEKEACFAH
jgi:hypothetical protein